jgi:RND superfamily putative drug exporter
VVPHYAPSQRALLTIGAKFHESNSTSLAMIVLEANRPLGDADHQYYDELMRRLLQDTKHVQSSIDLWGKPITAAGAQSLDGKCTYVLLRLAGDIGQMQANRSVDAVRDIVAKDTPPPGLKVYVSGAAPLASDTVAIANSSLNNITIVTIFLIIAGCCSWCIAAFPPWRCPCTAFCSSCWSRRGLSQPSGISGTSSSRHSP